MEKLLIRGGRVIDPANGVDQVADVLVEDGKIAAVGEGLSAEGAAVYDAAGKVVAPGFIDMHCHLRDPGQEYKEDIGDAGKRRTRLPGRRGFQEPKRCGNGGNRPDEGSRHHRDFR